jgi:hypothetical protein
VHNRQTPEHGDIHMIEKPAAVLAGGIDHSTGKAALRHEPDERVVWSLIGKCNSIRLTRRVQLAQRAHAILLRRVCIQTEFDVARASVDDSRRCACERLRLDLGLADDRADASAMCYCIDCRPHQGRRGGAKRAVDVLDVDDFGPVLDGGLCFLRVGYAREHEGH